MLGIGRQRIGMLVDVARGRRQIVLAPVGTYDGGTALQQTKHGLQVTLHGTLLLGLHVVADGIVLGLYGILLAIAEPVHGEVSLQRMAIGELIDTAQIPAEALVAHLVVGASRDVLTGVGTVRNLVAVVQSGIECQLAVGSEGELLPNDARAVARKVGGYGLLGLRVRAFLILQRTVLIAVGAVVGKRGIGPKAVLEDVDIDALCQNAMSTDACVAGDADQRTGGLVGDDVDDTAYGITAVE